MEVTTVDEKRVNTRLGRKEPLTTIDRSAITNQVVDKNHVIGWSDAKVIGTEEDEFKRWIKEGIEIRKRGKSIMNRDEGQYNLTHIFDEFLQPTRAREKKQTGNSAKFGNYENLPNTE